MRGRLLWRELNTLPPRSLAAGLIEKRQEPPPTFEIRTPVGVRDPRTGRWVVSPERAWHRRAQGWVPIDQWLRER